MSVTGNPTATSPLRAASKSSLKVIFVRVSVVELLTMVNSRATVDPMRTGSARNSFEKSIGARPLLLHNEQRSLSGFLYIEPCVCNWPFIARLIQKTGGFSNVSKQAIIIRLQELGLVINETTAEIGWHRQKYTT